VDTSTTLGPTLGRRRLLQLGAAAATALGPLQAFSKTPDFGVRSLKLENLHTGEARVVPYWENGFYIDGALNELNHLLRDHRTGDVLPIDRNLFDLLHRLGQRLEIQPTYQIISCYRSPKTNAMLAAQSGGVAKKSLHCVGKAIDIRTPERDLDILHKAALGLSGGGVGKYTKSNFVHVDTGRVRRW
jgi:uncharacterized protein YcbK (DUF882 family)